jgi:hypothetical protein
MNLGLSGPIADLVEVVVKARIGKVTAPEEHLHLARELKELVDIDGGIFESL